MKFGASPWLGPTSDLTVLWSLVFF